MTVFNNKSFMKSFFLITIITLFCFTTECNANLQTSNDSIQAFDYHKDYGYQEEYRLSNIWPLLRQSWYFSLPVDIAIDNEKYIYIADSIRGVHKLTNNGFCVKNFEIEKYFEYPISITLDSNFIYILDVRQKRIKKFNLATNVSDTFDIRSNNNVSLEELNPFGFLKAIKGDLFAILHFPYNKSYLQRYSSDGELKNDWPMDDEGGHAFSIFESDDKLIIYVTDKKKVIKYHLHNHNDDFELELELVDNDFIPYNNGDRITALATDQEGLLYVRTYNQTQHIDKISKYKLNGNVDQVFDISDLELLQIYDPLTYQYVSYNP